MPVVRCHTYADHQIEQSDQEYREDPGLYDTDLFPHSGGEVKRPLRRTSAHAGQAPEAFLGLHHLFFLNIDKRGAVLRAGMAVDTLLFVPSDLDGAYTAEQTEERAVGAEIAAPEVLHQDRKQDQKAHHHRPGQAAAYHPGETNIRRADVVVINKASESTTEGVKEIRLIVKKLNPGAKIIVAESPVEIQPLPPVKFSSLRGKKVLVVEDGPTLTHGGMPFGAGYVAAVDSGARVVSPYPYAMGSLKAVFAKYRHVRDVLPAMGYSKGQLKDLEHTIKLAPADAVILATPVDLSRLIQIDKPAFKVTYSIREKGPLTIRKLVREFLAGRRP